MALGDRFVPKSEVNGRNSAPSTSMASYRAPMPSLERRQKDREAPQQGQNGLSVSKANASSNATSEDNGTGCNLGERDPHD